MNYLAHAYLSFGNAETLAGNMIGDFVKGRKAVEEFPAGIQTGIMLHRFIDSSTDEHPAVARAKLLFRPVYHLYAGAIVDCLMDHFLAGDPKFFASESHLLAFTQDTYAKVESMKEHLPPDFLRMFAYMRDENWLYKYRTLPGIKRSLNGVAHRAQGMASPEQAYEIFITNYYHLNQCYFELIDDIIRAVKMKLTVT